MDLLRRWQQKLKRDALALEAVYHTLLSGSDDPDALHALRVAVRGLRARLTPFTELPAVAAIRNELGALAHDTNALRDDEVMRELLAALPGSAPLLARLAPPDRSTPLSAILATHLASVDALHQRVLSAVDLLESAQVASASRLATRRARRKLQRALAVLTPATPAHDWHAARLLVKKARYLHEGQALWLDLHWRRFGAQCKPAQEALGHLHDLDVLHDRYGEHFDPALESAWQIARRRSLVDADSAVWRLNRILQP
ncbi:hypothetical protein JHS3_12420 [Jeongeupia sp. HS-3]|uniref:CHAD domain-containing protein n=1 Tax=Jeongeupia sp. HS-3 TaxID=1009682 RepID=UPI0018A37C0A|nr:CHAD domain-containing protein [Jeongeupia sp. HS-3]BCL75506.1 hypothetical protein JHS3_12420 [Jeongeupia sp. HS-3]